MPAITKLLFMGSPDYAVPTLAALDGAFPHTLVGVVSQPDRPKGRHHHHLYPTPVKQWGLDHTIPVFTPLTKDELVTVVDQLRPDVIVVVAYGRILPKTITDRYFCLNSHGSLLPRHRGASPVQASLLAGDTQTGITLIHMDEQMDHGDVVYSRTFDIPEDMHFGDLFHSLSELSAVACVDFFLQHYIPNTVQSIAQPITGVTYCSKLNKPDFELKTDETQLEWLRKIRAFSPLPGAYIHTERGRVKVLRAQMIDGQLVPLIIQSEGKKPMPYSEYLRGHPRGLTLPLC
jgi:methionyl-tRNA formyltransferase